MRSIEKNVLRDTKPWTLLYPSSPLGTTQQWFDSEALTMPQRYAHLRDDVLRRAADLAGQIIAEADSTAKKADGKTNDPSR